MTNNFAVKIMLLDDEPFMLKLIGRQLENLGYTALSPYTSGAAALDALTGPSGPPELILLDLNMPEMDGIEFVRHLVERHYAGSLVLISGEDERMLQASTKLVQAHNIKVLGHLRKPVSPTALAALLEGWAPAATARLRTAKAAYDVEAVRAAINNGELVNYYQPKVAVADGRVVGVETLVRWRHPVDGMVYPDQFIGVAEAHGLIDDLTRVRCFRAALAQARVWLLTRGMALARGGQRVDGGPGGAAALPTSSIAEALAAGGVAGGAGPAGGDGKPADEPNLTRVPLDES
jgi:CheY-like chemotaxis protein